MKGKRGASGHRLGLLRWAGWLLMALFLWSCGVKTPGKPEFVRQPGSYFFYKGKLRVVVQEDPGGNLNYRVGNERAMAGPSKAPFTKGTDWFIYPANEQTVWIYDAQGEVALIELLPEGGSKFSSSRVVPDLLNRAPREFLEKLPANTWQGTKQ